MSVRMAASVNQMCLRQTPKVRTSTVKLTTCSAPQNLENVKRLCFSITKTIDPYRNSSYLNYRKQLICRILRPGEMMVCGFVRMRMRNKKFSYRRHGRRRIQNSGHYAVQGHLMSPISVPIESPYAIYILSRTVSYLPLSIRVTFDRCLSLTHSLGWTI